MSEKHTTAGLSGFMGPGDEESVSLGRGGTIRINSIISKLVAYITSMYQNMRLMRAMRLEFFT